MGHWRKIRASYLFLGGERNATISGHVIDKIQVLNAPNVVVLKTQSKDFRSFDGKNCSQEDNNSPTEMTEMTEMLRGCGAKISVLSVLNAPNDVVLKTKYVNQ